jgi:hypothetical protein
VLRQLQETYPTEAAVSHPTARCLVAVAIVLACLFWLFTVKPAPAMNHGFNPDAPLAKWFESKLRPDVHSPCCGKGDAYPVARVKRNADHTWTVWLEDGSAIEYPDGTHRDYVDKNVPIIVPDNKVNPPDDDLDNPTDVGWIFMKSSMIYCLIVHSEGN